MSNLADTLWGVLAAYGWTPCELAARSGLHRQTVLAILNEGRNPTWTNVRMMCRALGITPGQLDALQGEPDLSYPLRNM